MNTLVVNCFAGPGAGKTGCAWSIAAELKKLGKVVEYVPEYAKELVWRGNLQMLDGSLGHQTALLQEQKSRIDCLIGKVDYVITDSPLLLNASYLNPQSGTYEKNVVDIFNNYNNFNVFIQRNEKNFEKEGRIHGFEESKKLDGEIKDMLKRNNIYFGTYRHSNINEIVKNIQYTHDRLQKPSILARCAKKPTIQPETTSLKEVVKID